MANLKLLLVLLIGFSAVSTVLSASMMLDEPDMEASTNMVADDSDDTEEDGEMVDDKEGMVDGEEEMTDEEGEEGMNDEGKEMTDEEEGMDDDGKEMTDEEEGMDDEVKEMTDEEEGMDDEGEKNTDEVDESAYIEAEGEDKMTDEDENEETKESGADGSGDCVSADNPVVDTLKSLVDYIKLLGEEIQDLKEKVGNSCGGQGSSEEDSSEEDDSEEEGSGEGNSEEEPGSGNGEESTSTEEDQGGEDMSDGEEKEEEEGKEDEGDESEMDGEEETTAEDAVTTTLPPPPETCPPPFQLLAGSCYYIQTDNREWRSWGDSNAFCQQQGGSLAAPYRAEELIEYLQSSYSGAMWIGARATDNGFMWLNDREISSELWKDGTPNEHPARRCVLLDSRNSYKAVNFFCGEKFSFVCEHRS